MTTQIKLVINSGYKWTCSDNVYFKGYFQYRNDPKCEVYKELKAIQVLKEIDSSDKLSDLLNEVEGCYSLIIKKKDFVLFAVDKARSLPLFCKPSF